MINWLQQMTGLATTARALAKSAGTLAVNAAVRAKLNSRGSKPVVYCPGYAKATRRRLSGAATIA